MMRIELVEQKVNSAAEMAAWTKDNLPLTKFAVFDVTSWISTKEQFTQLCVDFGDHLGTRVVQNAEGATVVEVYDRNNGTIARGARYHQTREGGDIHVDSVNGFDPFDYLILGCLAPATRGGQSILLRACDVLAELQQFPEALSTLQEEFWFEERGMLPEQEVGLFKMPILSFEREQPRFRYLRSYIESAHEKAGADLGDRERAAFDKLDAILAKEELQFRHTLQRGQILVTADTEVFHGRTGFIDEPRSDKWSSQRKMLRLWIS